ncbi:RNA polymerase sigma-70 factor, ECF subfamily [Gracilibacillus orientalis]|uniref:RNA polymerase sigma-70 factor, ECF subfamily n=1 Tax=Gracilibacillus orientalis TaxID=334253 RepID=A0A1I4HFR2_9BACI|nr:sigma-70 family RNA polymerase sigma factor [Gracilibacillus orientalis]SFL41022.1 RNA polymerase sigma-70 factor, ECF subfamily [Gracilibacillus orientalis]
MKELKLIKKAIKGNKECLEELLVIHGDQLYRTAYIYVRNREDALDIVQETSFKAFLSIGQLKNEKFFLTWLTKILINCSYDLLKKSKKELPWNNITELTADKKENIEEYLDLLEAINRLDEKHKNAIILFYFQDLPISEIAKVLNIPENTVKTYLSRGKRRLKKMLGGVNHNGEKITSRII